MTSDHQMGSGWWKSWKNMHMRNLLFNSCSATSRFFQVYCGQFIIPGANEMLITGQQMLIRPSIILIKCKQWLWKLHTRGQFVTTAPPLLIIFGFDEAFVIMSMSRCPLCVTEQYFILEVAPLYFYWSSLRVWSQPKSFVLFHCCIVFGKFAPGSFPLCIGWFRRKFVHVQLKRMFSSSACNSPKSQKAERKQILAVFFSLERPLTSFWGCFKFSVKKRKSAMFFLVHLSQSTPWGICVWTKEKKD